MAAFFYALALDRRMEKTPEVELIEVSKRFGETSAVRRISLSIHPGEFLTLLGPSGCGKTTLLRLIAGFETPDEGRVRLGGRDVTEEPPYRRAVTTVFQQYALFPHLDVFKNVAFGLERRRIARDEVERRVGEALDMVRLKGLERRRPSELSGGQQQRVALARAVVLRPRVLLLDEPLAALDLKLRKGMQVELKWLQRQLGVSFVYVTHDQEEALTMSDRVVVMNAGCVEQTGTPREIYEQPGTEFVADFIGASNMIRGTLVSTSDHTSVVEIAGTNVEVACICGAPGDTVRVMVRPEKVALLPEGKAGTLEGRVEEGLYLGDSTQWRVRIADGQEVTVHEQNRGPGQSDRIGKLIAMQWDPASAVLFRG